MEAKINGTDRYYLKLVARGRLYKANPSRHAAAMADLEARGLVTTVLAEDRPIRRYELTEAGREACLANYLGRFVRAGR